jgi:HPt (histidine-containing phosphotransfer) domain-containing protein
MKEIMIENIPSFDWRLSVNLAGGNKKLAKLVLNQILANLPTEAALINNAFRENDLSKLQDLIHKLYGACCYSGFLKLKHILKQILNKININNLNKNYCNNCTQINQSINLFNQEIAYLLKNHLTSSVVR